MTKLIDCPECGETKPVRDDAKVCCGSCRVKAWRKKKMRECPFKSKPFHAMPCKGRNYEDEFCMKSVKKCVDSVTVSPYKPKKNSATI
jgi:hypothetical protein